MSRPIPVAQVNHFAAGKQHLLPAAAAPDVEALVEDLVALHATDPATVYLSAWARVGGFRREHLERALYESRSLVRWLCMRQTLHVVSRLQVAHFHQATARRLYDQNRRRLEKLLVDGELFSRDSVGERLDTLSRAVLDLVAEHEGMSAQKVTAEIPELQGHIVYAPGKPYEAKIKVGSRIIYLLGIAGQLVRGRPRGGWKSHLFDYAALEQWLPEVDLEAAEPADARRWLVRRYLGTFGPVTLKDITWWTGFTVRDTRKAVAELGAELAEVAVEGHTGELLMLAEQVDALRGCRPEAGWACLLPALDPYVMGYQDRRRFLAAEHVAPLFDRNGNAGPTVWVDGRIVGGWGQQEGRVVHRVFEPLSPAAETSLAELTGRLQEFLGGDSVPPRFPTPLVRELGG